MLYIFTACFILLVFRHGQICDSSVYSGIRCNLYGILDGSGGLLEEVTRKYHSHRNLDVASMLVAT